MARHMTVPRAYGGTVRSCWSTTVLFGKMVATIVGRKNASPCTVMLFRRKIIAVVMAMGLVSPRLSFARVNLSTTSVVAILSDLTRSFASVFCSSVNHLALSGRSVRVPKATIPTTTVTIPTGFLLAYAGCTARTTHYQALPSMRKIIFHEWTDPTPGSLRIAEARSPPKAPASEAEMMKRDRRNVSSLLLYQRDR